MPRIIKGLHESILTAVRTRLLTEDGVPAPMTIRDISDECGIAVGTIYNYFDSKEDMVASVMLEDWKEMCSGLEKKLPKQEREDGIRMVYEGVRDFSKKFGKVWEKNAQHASFPYKGGKHHPQIVAQVSELLKLLPMPATVRQTPYLVEFTAEAILRYASDGVTEYDKVAPALQRLLGRK